MYPPGHMIRGQYQPQGPGSGGIAFSVAFLRAESKAVMEKEKKLERVALSLNLEPCHAVLFHPVVCIYAYT